MPIVRHPFILLLVMFSFFGCFNKKSNPKNITEWLEVNFPGQLTVVDRNQNYDVVDWLFSGKKIALVADQSDPAVQFTITWHKPSGEDKSLGIDLQEVRTLLDSCRAEAAQARTLFTLLKNNGLQQFSVGVIQQAAYILVFAEPTPETRKTITTIIKNTLDARPTQPQTSIWIEILEPSAFHTEFEDIVPFAHWKRPGTWHRDKKIMSLDFEWKSGIPVSALLGGWQISTDSERSNGYLHEAYAQAKVWANKNLKKPNTIGPDSSFYIQPTDQDPLAIRFSFPFYNAPVDGEAAAEPAGYVVGLYQTDEKKFINIKQAKEW